MADYREVTACRLCDSTQLTQALDLGETPLANELDGAELFPLVVNRCESCCHHQLSIAVAPERLWGPNYPYQSGTSPVFRAHLEALADEVAGMVKPGATVFEIASNDGTLCRMLSERGLRAKGTDPSGPVVSTDSPYLRLWQEPWPRPDRVRGMSCILALNVFAHVDDLHGFTAAVKEALAPDGVFIVEVGWLPDVTRLGLFDVIYHEHFSYHTLSPLMMFFERHGLRITKTLRMDSQGGSIRLHLRHAEEVGDYRPGGVDVVYPVSGLRPIIDSRAAVLREALNRHFQRDEMVCIYGAPAKLTTLLYATGLESMPFSCVGEDNQRKVGRTTPGNHIPIVSVEEMLARKPDSILVAAWNFFDDICRRLREKGFKGGIINPMVNAGEVE